MSHFCLKGAEAFGYVLIRGTNEGNRRRACDIKRKSSG